MATRQRRSSASSPELNTDALSDDERAVWQMPINGAQLAVQDEGAQVEETAVDRVASMLGAFSADDKAVVKLYRVLGPNKISWCQDYSVVEFEQGGFELIRSQWGPGEYSVRVMASSNAAGGVSLKRVANVSIQAPAAGPAPAAQSNAADSSLARAVEAMMQSQQRFQQDLLQALTQRPDPMAQMRDTMGLMTMMREAMGLSGQAQQKSSIREIVDAIQELKGVAEMVNPPEPDPDNLLSMLPGVLDLVKAGMQNRPQQAAPIVSPPAPALLPNPAPVQPQGEPASQDPQPNQEDPMLQLIQKTMAPLYTMAVAGVPPQVGADYVDSVSDTLSDEQFEQLSEVLQHPQWFEGLCAVMPDFKPHEAWMREVHKLYGAMLAEDEPEAPAATPPASTPSTPGGEK